MEKVFELKDAHFSYLGKIPALCGVNLDIEKGSKVSVIGANGTGKSTLLAMLDALVFPDKGDIKAFGAELNEGLFRDSEFTASFRRRVGFVFQNPDVQLFCPTVREDIVFGPLQLGVRESEVKKRLDKIAHDFHLGELLDRPPYQLSIGEKKKVAVASIIAIEPEIFLLDEPTAGLDPQTTRNIIDLILKEHEKGKTIVTATHDLHIVEEVSDIVHVLSEAKNIIRSGTPHDILSDSIFLKENNLVHIHSHKHKDGVHIHPHLHIEHHGE
ncbi:MAG: energy-coupling factor ABC transporter ATP-binding protein [Candidatus Omnitrophica bacterium]|nr:energy-coupling factor ABC transporter ATP-binding protein [Candidatus Omnitrophota bacterium]MBU4488678.1 energy-coupling factor ABC transporter ATP-binding protein [Candidatus Omnitrophota bacterium]MCG2704801.1 energy-coupling factor ABC transporter ATP-binding protein [Candidatus Omnitrophota bacterium]